MYRQCIAHVSVSELSISVTFDDGRYSNPPSPRECYYQQYKRWRGLVVAQYTSPSVFLVHYPDRPQD